MKSYELENQSRLDNVFPLDGSEEFDENGEPIRVNYTEFKSAAQKLERALLHRAETGIDFLIDPVSGMGIKEAVDGEGLHYYVDGEHFFQPHD